MQYTPFIPILLLGASHLSLANTALNNDDGCDCYVVSGPDPGYFQHHRFYDFRTSQPAAADGNVTHPSLQGTTFARDWSVEAWQRPQSKRYPVRIVNSYENVYLDRVRENSESELGPMLVENESEIGGQYAADPLDSTRLVFRTTRMENHVSTAEVVTRTNNILHCSLRVRLRLSASVGDLTLSARDIDEEGGGDDGEHGEDEEDEYDEGVEESPRLAVPGAVAGLFTYFSSTSESDIEILTSDPPHVVHYANQPAYNPITDTVIPDASTAVTLPTPWTEWGVHRLDWFPAISRWYADGEMTLEKEYGVPQRGSLIVLNLWSDGGVWSGNMTVGSSVYMAIEWIEVVYNTTATFGPAEPGDDEAKTSYRRPRPRPVDYPVADPNTHHQDPKDDTTPEKQGECVRVCRVDDVQTVGLPEAI